MLMDIPSHRPEADKYSRQFSPGGTAGTDCSPSKASTEQTLLYEGGDKDSKRKR
jgi:hypothetical protein